MQPQELTVTAFYPEGAPDAGQIILDSLAFFLKKEICRLLNGGLSQEA